jgi:hypothetical protein
VSRYEGGGGMGKEACVGASDAGGGMAELLSAMLRAQVCV